MFYRLTSLLHAGDKDGFTERLKKLIEEGRYREAPGSWGREEAWKGDVVSRKVQQLVLLFFAKKGDVVIMTSSGTLAPKDMTAERARFVIGILHTEPVFHWMDPDEIGAKLAKAPGKLKDGAMKQERDGSYTRLMPGRIAVRPVTWLRAGLCYDLDKVDKEVRPYFGKIVRYSCLVLVTMVSPQVQPTVAKIKADNLAGRLPRVLNAFLDVSSPIKPRRGG